MTTHTPNNPSTSHTCCKSVPFLFALRQFNSLSLYVYLCLCVGVCLCVSAESAGLVIQSDRLGVGLLDGSICLHYGDRGYTHVVRILSHRNTHFQYKSILVSYSKFSSLWLLNAPVVTFSPISFTLSGCFRSVLSGWR